MSSLDDYAAPEDPPIITFHAPGKTFDRFFKEKSLASLRGVVREKLRLTADVDFDLAQLRGGKQVDLEDLEDFKTFKAIANAKRHVDVTVTFKDTPSSRSVVAAEQPDSTSKSLPKKRPRSSSPSPSNAVPVKPVTKRAEPSPALTPATLAKKRKVTFGEANGDISTPLKSAMKAASLEARSEAEPDDDATAAPKVKAVKKRGSTSDMPNVPKRKTKLAQSDDLPAHAELTAATTASPLPPLSLSAPPKAKKSSTSAADSAAATPEDPTAALLPPSSAPKVKKSSKASTSKEKVQSAALDTSSSAPSISPAPLAKEKRKRQTDIPDADGTSKPAAKKSKKSDITAAVEPQLSPPLPSGVSPTEATTLPLVVDPPTKPARKKTPSKPENTSSLPLPTEERVGKKSKKVKAVDDEVAPKKKAARKTKDITVAEPATPLSGALVSKPADTLAPPAAKKAALKTTKDSASAKIRHKVLGNADSLKALEEQSTGRTSASTSQSAKLVWDNLLSSNAATPLSVAERSATPASEKSRSSEQSEASVETQVVALRSVSSSPSERDQVTIQSTEPVFSSPKPPSTAVLKPPPSVDPCPACFSSLRHPLAECPVVLEGVESIETCIAEFEDDPDLAEPQVVAELRALADKARSQKTEAKKSALASASGARRSSSPVDKSRDAIAERAATPVSVTRPTIPEGLTITEVSMETQDEGSSNDSSSSSSSSEDEDDVDDPKEPLVLDEVSYREQLAAIMGGPERRGPRRSILDDIPSHSSTESESDSDDEQDEKLDLDDEEDERPLSRRRAKKAVREKSSSEERHIEGESEDEDEGGSLPVFMDGSGEVPVDEPPRSTVKLPAVEVRGPSSSGVVPPVVTAETASFTTQERSETSVQKPRPSSASSDGTAINTEPSNSPPLTNDRVLVSDTPEPPSRAGKVAATRKGDADLERTVDAGGSDTEEDDEIESFEDVEAPPKRQSRELKDDPIDLSPSKPSLVQRMKDKSGKPRSSTSQPPRSPASTPRPTLQVTQLDLDVFAETEDASAETETALGKRRSTRLASPPPSIQVPEPAPAQVPKRRGRPPLSAEEKARRAAAKEAEKEEKAEARRAARAGTGKKGPAKPRLSRGSTSKSSSVPADVAPATPAPEHAPRSPASVMKWTVLPEPEPTQPSEGSAFDELGSSSPPLSHATKPAPVTVPTDLPPSSDVEVSPAVSLARKAEKQSDAEPREESQLLPLFLPGSSQYPIESQLAADDRDDEEEPSPKKPSIPARRPPALPYRRLTDIASQHDIFSPSQTLSSQAIFEVDTPSERRKSGLSKVQDMESSSDSSGSDSDGESHIPENRRAGAQKKKGGLLSRFMNFG